MTVEHKKTDASWQCDNQNVAHKWEFYKTPQGLWNWRLVSPEGWDHCKAEWKQNAAWNAQTWGSAVTNQSHWDSLKGKIEWVEVSRSPEGYPSKTECQASAKKHGWCL